MAKEKAKPEAADEDQQEQGNITIIITQGDLHEAFYAAVKHDYRTQRDYLLADAAKAQEAIGLFDKYKAIAGGLKPGQLQKYNDLKRLVKGR